VNDLRRERAQLKMRIRRRGIYVLPNLFTTGALFFGFYSIVQGMNHRFEAAAVAIVVAMVLDGLDGRVARMTKTQSAFGTEYDSLSDMVSFGVAPALVMYVWALSNLGKAGWLAAFVYVAGAALRLARFNTNVEVVDKRFFQGLPSPAAAALVACFIWVSADWQIPVRVGQWIGFAVTLFGGLTMVTTVPFWSGKSINLKRSVPFIALFAMVLGFALLSYEPALVLFLASVLYGLSGYVLFVWRWLRRRRAAQSSPPPVQG
jgi:CDP-diacylglycerol--serine O-phosphatidyltransferase